MTATQLSWLILGALWVLFFGWYTSFGGPLTEAEIEAYLEVFDAHDLQVDQERILRMRQFMEEDTGDDFVMLNIGLQYAQPIMIEGVEPGQSSEEVLLNYLDYVVPALLSRASHPVQFGEAASAAMELLNAEGMGIWENTVSMRYRSRRDFMDFVTDSRMPAAHAYKVAAVERTIAIPIDPWFHFGDLRLMLALVFGLVGCGLSWSFAETKNRANR